MSTIESIWHNLWLLLMKTSVNRSHCLESILILHSHIHVVQIVSDVHILPSFLSAVSQTPKSIKSSGSMLSGTATITPIPRVTHVLLTLAGVDAVDRRVRANRVFDFNSQARTPDGDSMLP